MFTFICLFLTYHRLKILLRLCGIAVNNKHKQVFSFLEQSIDRLYHVSIVGISSLYKLRN